MINKTRIKAGMVVVAAVMAGLVVSAPTASASGNCYHYGTPGYAQIFTDINFGGDCYEWWMESDPAWFPSYMKNKGSSIRVWSGWPGHGVILRDDFFATAKYQIPANAWFSSLGNFNDAADYADLGPLQG